MSTSMRILMAFAIIVINLPAEMVMAAEPAPVISDIQQFGPYFDQLASFEEFGKIIPMSNVSPGEVMGLNKLFSDSFTYISNNPGSVPYSLDITSISYVDNVTADFNYDGEGAVVLELRANQSMALPIYYVNNPEEDPNPSETGTCFDAINNDDDNLIDGDDPDCAFIMIDGGEVQNVDFDLVATFTFDLEGDVIYLKGEPTITLTYDSGNGTVESFSTRYGFADISVAGNAIYNAEIGAVIRDENLDGKIFISDWDNTILVDLVEMEYKDQLGVDDVNIHLTFTAPLLGETGVEFLTLVIENLGDESVHEPELTPSPALASFTTVSADDMLTGLASYAYALNSIWVVNEGDLPFIKEKLHNQFMPGESLLNLVKRQGDALIMCGTEPTTPPVGNPDTGETVYCQAFTSQEPSSVEGWSVAGIPIEDFRDANGNPDTLAHTIGLQPTAWVVVEPSNWKNIEVKFNYTDGESETTHIAEPRVRSVNELQAKIEQTLDTTVPVSFDAETRTLVYDINKDTDPEPGSVHLAFGNKLRQASGVTNVQDSWTADTEDEKNRAEVDIGDVTIKAGFGTILVPDVADISSNSSATEVGDLCTNNLDDDGDGLIDSYDPDCPQKEDRFFMDLSNGDRVLSVDGLTVNVPAGYSMPGTIGALGVDVASTSFSITSSSPFAVDLNPVTIAVEGLEPIQNAVGVKDLIANATDGGIFVSHSQSMTMVGGLHVTSQGLTPVQAGDISIEWIDISDTNQPTITFSNPALKAFDLYPADSQTPENPQALITLILDSLYNRASAIYNSTDQDGNPMAGKPLPVIGMSMRELAPQIKNVMNAAVSTKTGKSIADISCSVNLDESLLECWAVTSLEPGDITTVAWSIHNFAVGPVTNEENVNTIWPNADPAKVQFFIDELTDTQALASISVELVINDEITIEYPYHPPQTLLELKQTLASKLEIPEDNIQFSVSDSPDGYLLNVILTIEDGNNTNFPLRLSLSHPDDPDTVLATLTAKEKTLGLTSDISFNLAYSMPLDLEFAMDGLAFQESTAVEVDVSVDESDFDEIEASLGGYSLKLGNLSTASGMRPGLEIKEVKTESETYLASGEEITLKYTVENSGAFTLKAPFAVVDDKFDVTCPPDSDTLTPGDSIICTASYTTTAEDVSELAVTSTAFATGYFGKYKIASPNIIVSIKNQTDLPKLELFVNTAPELLGDVGSAINYTYTIKNTGNVLVDGPFSIEDDQLTADCSAAAPSLAVDGTTTCTATPPHTVTQADIDSGFSTTATATGFYGGNTISSNSVNHTIFAEGDENANPEPSLSIHMSTEHLFGVPGDTLAVTYLITNTGNVNLSGPFEIGESHFGEPTCAAPPSGALAPGGTITCDPITYPPSDVEWNAGFVEGTATASANYGGVLVSSEETASAALTNVSKQSELTVAVRSRLAFKDSAWEWSLQGSNDGDDIIVNLAARTDEDVSESLGLLTYQGEASADPIITMPPEMIAGLGIRPLDVSLLPLSLPLLSDFLLSNLDGDRWNIRRPMVGGNLAAGADIASVLNGWENALSDLDIAGAANPNDVYTIISGAVTDSVFDSADLVVTVYCGDADCNDDVTSSVNEITGVQISVNNYFKDQQPQPIPFETGLPGVPLESTDENPLSADPDLTINLTFGIDRFKGPYIAQNANALKVDSTVTIAEQTTPIANTGATSKINFEASDTRYMKGVIGLFPGMLYDAESAGEQSQVDLITTLGIGRELTYADLLNGLGAQAPVSEIPEGGAARINLLFVTDSDGSIPLPQIAGTIHLTYGNEDGYEMSYNDVYMNTTSFFGDFLGPALEDVQNYTKPLQPVIDTVTTPIPVVSDLSTMVGQGEITLLTLLKAASGSEGIALIEKLAVFISYVNHLPVDPDNGGVWIGLGESDSGDEEAGSFSIDVEVADEPECGDDDSSPSCSSDEVKKPKTKDEKKGKKDDDIDSDVKWEGAGISLPILRDTGQIYGMLMGIDATLIRVDLGTLSASAGLEYSYGPFMIGPVPVSITIGGTVTLSGRFAMGYDTRGMHQLLRGESLTGDALIDGIFIDDLDADGNDVPEIVLEVEIYAGASVSIKIFEAGIQAGVIFGVDLNWNDPNDDGKLRIEEIAMWMFKPICLFDRHGYMRFYLKFYLEIDLFLFTARIEWTPLEKTFDLFDVSCVPPQPVLGQVDDENHRFRLNMGTYDGARNLPAGDDEKFIVRQLTPEGEGCASNSGDDSCGTGEGTWISITFMGIYQEWLVPDGYFIYAEAGKGKDTISLLPGTDKRPETRGDEIPFTLDSELHGGSGDDKIDTGLGDDTVYGDADNDTITTRGGNDTIYGGPGIDSLDGGIGFDLILGGADNDVLNGGPGSDVMDGGAGDDSLSGGPGLPPGQTADTSDETLEDLADLLIGGVGDDVLEGTFGRDYLFGDDPFDSSIPELDALRDNPTNWDNIIDKSVECVNESGTGRDNLVGGADDDYLFGGGDDDQLQGEKGDDILCGNSGHDTLVGSTGNDKLNGGPDDDDLMGGDGKDELEGGSGNDILLGDTLNIDNHPVTESGYLVDHPADTTQPPPYVAPMNESFENPQLYDDVLSGGPDNDFLFGEIGTDTIYGDGFLALDGSWSSAETGGNDYMEGNAGNDNLYGTNGSDHMLGGQGNDTMYGGFKEDSDPNVNTDSGDFMWGNSGDDDMWGNAGDDQMNGNTGDDYIEGNSGQDTIHGGPDADQIIGGSGKEQQNDTGDYLYGDEDADWIAGDNAIINETGVILLDVETLSASIDPNWYGGDTIYGNDGADHIWGQGGMDTISGGEGDDYIEGNHAYDVIAGDAGHDVILGGSSPLFTGLSTDAYTDTGDEIHGGSGNDIIAGDNARIVRPSVMLLNVETQLNGVDPALYGDDTIFGDEGNDKIWGQGGEDEIEGGDGDDYIEGNHASDKILGGDGDDDILGGGSPLFAGPVPITYTDVSTDTRQVPLGQTPAVDVPLGDTIYGGDGSDCVLGDNGTITRTGGQQTYALEIATVGDIEPLHITGDIGSRAVREVQMLNSTPGYNAGSDLIYGGAGDDDLYGQFDDTSEEPPAIGDEIWGEDGEDLILGDQGTAISSVLRDTTRTIRSKPPFLKDVILLLGTLHRVATLDQTIEDGNDRLSGGNGSDFIHAGGGDDLINGNDGNDRLFGDNGNDAIWGGTHHDHLWGGYGNDYLDVLPRESRIERERSKLITYPPDPLEWQSWTVDGDYEGIDFMYGGFGQDAMQADVSPTGPAAGDRLIDWVGVYNIYYLCGPQYGEYVITRSPSPSVIDFLTQLAIGDGAFEPEATGSSGFEEIAIVYNSDFKTNSHPPHAETPGHFTCP